MGENLIAVKRDGQVYGPYTSEELRNYVADGSILPSDLGKTERSSQWESVSDLMSRSCQQPEHTPLRDAKEAEDVALAQVAPSPRTGEPKPFFRGIDSLMWRPALAAAGVVLLAGIGTYLWLNKMITFKDCADCPEMVVIPAGSFEMGFVDSVLRYPKPDRLVATPVHTVRIGKPFALGQTEVTQRQWRAVMGSNPSGFSNCDDCPVENVTWSDAQNFVRKLTEMTGKTYRLPSEAEWEYACRAGRTHTYCGSDNEDRVAWHETNSDKKTHPVGTKQPNAWGLHDMSGNVEEWTEDCSNLDYSNAPADGGAWITGNCKRRVVRGGNWETGERSGARWSFDSSWPYNNLGFRLARTLP